MKTFTKNYNFEKHDQEEFYDVGVQSKNMDQIDNVLTEVSSVILATGTGNLIKLNMDCITNYRNGLKLTFIANDNNNSGKILIQVNDLKPVPLYRPGTKLSPTLSLGKAYDIWFDSSLNSFFHKASAEGSAVASDVLANKTFCNDIDCGIVGTMPNRSLAHSKCISYDSHSMAKTLFVKPQEGFFDGKSATSQCYIQDENFSSSNIKAGISIFGVSGKSTVVDTSTASAVATDLLESKTAYINGEKIVGTIPTAEKNQISVFTTSGLPHSASVYNGFIDYYLSPYSFVDSGYARRAFPNLIPSNIKAGVSIGDGVGPSISGTFTSDANAVSGQIIGGASAYVNGVKLNGTMPVHQNTVHSLPVNGTYIMPAGYHNGTTKVSQSLPTLGAQTITPGITNQIISSGQYLTGLQTVLGDSDLIASNIKKGVNIFGVEGVLNERKYAEGTFTTPSTSTSNSLSINTGFRPRMVLIFQDYKHGGRNFLNSVLTDFELTNWEYDNPIKVCYSTFGIKDNAYVLYRDSNNPMKDNGFTLPACPKEWNTFLSYGFLLMGTKYNFYAFA